MWTFVFVVFALGALDTDPASSPAAETSTEATANESTEPAAEPSPVRNEVNGYLDLRTEFARARVHGLLPTDDYPQLLELIELNAQLRHSYAARGFVYGDLSVIEQVYGMFRALD